MSDFGVLTALRTYLLRTETVGTNIHLTLPPMPKYPAVILELEEIMQGQGDGCGKVGVKIKVIAKELTPKVSLEIGGKVCHACEGQTLTLPNSSIGIMRVQTTHSGKQALGFSSLEVALEVLVRRTS